MTDEEIVREICDRAIKLADLKTTPLKAFLESGHRSFQFGSWKFELVRYVTEYWSFSGPKYGDVKSMSIRSVANYSWCPFYYNVSHSDPSYPWKIEREACEVMIFALRVGMVLDDLAMISVDKRCLMS